MSRAPAVGGFRDRTNGGLDDAGPSDRRGARPRRRPPTEVTRPTVASAERWRPMRCARRPTPGMPPRPMCTPMSRSRCRAWTRAVTSGLAPPPGRRLNALDVGRASQALARAMVMAAVAARDGAGQIAAAQADVLAHVADARADGFSVGDDGVVVAPPASPLLVALSGGDAAVACDLLTVRAAELGGRSARIWTASATPTRRGRRHRGGVHAACRAPGLADACELAGDGTGPDRRPDRGDDAGTARAPDRGVPAAGRKHRRRAVGDADRREPDQHRPGDRRTGRPGGGVAFYRDLLGEIDDPAGGAPGLTGRSSPSTRQGGVGGAQRQSGHRPAASRCWFPG